LLPISVKLLAQTGNRRDRLSGPIGDNQLTGLCHWQHRRPSQINLDATIADDIIYPMGFADGDRIYDGRRTGNGSKERSQHQGQHCGR
jgi:hypothetical protein